MRRTTEAWVQDEAGGLLVPREIALDPKPGDAVVEVAACGVCHTDLGFLDGSVAPRGGRPLVAGHEVSGTVIGAEGEHARLVGSQVIVPAVWPCGDCELCRRGRENACMKQRMPGNDVPGGFARHLVVPARCLAELRTPMPREQLEEMAVIADAVATPFEAVRRAEVSKGDFVVVVGAGGLGGFLVQIAAAQEARVLALDISAERLALAAAHGAQATLDVSGLGERDVRPRVRELAKGLGAAPWGWKIFETSGTAAGQRIGFDLLGPAATLAVVGYSRERLELRLSNLMAFDALAFGVWGCRPAYYPEVIELVRSGRVILAPFVERRPMREINDVIRSRHPRRVVLVPSSA